LNYKLPPGIKRILKADIFANFLNLSSIQLSNTLLLLLLYPVIIHKIGVQAFGLFTVANYFAILTGTFVNFGTSQSGVKDVAMNQHDTEKLSQVFYNTLIVRIVIFILFLSGFFLLKFVNLPNYNLYLFSVPLIFAEVLNPIFLYLGREKLALFNLVNLLTKVLIITAVIFFIKGSGDFMWINFIMGVITSAAYVFLLTSAIIRHQLHFDRINMPRNVLKLLKNNFYLVGNNISVQLQQSMIVFTLNQWGNPVWLGAYTVCDKITASARPMILAIFNSIYPKAASLFKENPAYFEFFKTRVKKMITLAFSALSIGLIIFAGPVIYIVTKQHNPLAELLLRIMALLPAVAALNSINVLELLVRDLNFFIFKISMVLLILSLILSLGIVFWGNLYWLGAYTLFIEISAVMMYEYIIKKRIFNTSFDQDNKCETV
jgi:O-antigen/teichoic acid export membrane protein